MSNIIEKFKALFSDENKTKEFIKDEEFIGKVSGGTVTEQDYINKFREFDIDLSVKDANEVMNATYKILSIPAEKLSDETIANIVGGKDAGVIVGGSVALASLAASAGTFVASAVYTHKGTQEVAKGNEMKAKYYKKYASDLQATSASLLVGAPFAGVIAGGAVDLITSAIRDEI